MTQLFRSRLPWFVARASSAVIGLLCWPATAWAASPLSPFTTIRTIETDAQGVILRTTYNPIAVLFLGLVALAVIVAAAWAVMTIYRMSTARGGSNGSLASPANVGASLDKHISSFLEMIRAQLASNAHFGEALETAQAKLKGLEDPKQIGVVIGVLVAENERMRRESNELKGKLENSQSEVAALRASLSEAQELSLNDPLTGVGNRRHFEMTLAKAVAGAVASKSPLCLVMCDLDNFKVINDKFGHTVGDDVLKMFTRLLTENVRDGDSVARFGGEEFAVILPKTAQESASNFAERVRRQCEARQLKVRTTNEPMGRLTASFGVAQLREGESPELLVERADAKLYEAKSTGRNRVAVYGR